MTPDEFRAWRRQLGFTQVVAAKVLDMSLRQIKMLEGGHTPIRRVIALACNEVVRRKRDAMR